MASIKWETANHMMDIIAFVVMKNCIEHEEQVDIENIKAFARDVFQEYCDTVGITEVEDVPDEEDTKVFEDGDFYDYYFNHYFDNDEEDGEEDGEEEDDEGSCKYSLTAKGEFALRYMEAGHTFEEACEVANILFGDGE